MTKFSPTEAGLEGFRVARENPRAFLLWALFSLAVSILYIVSMAMMPENIKLAEDTLSGKDADGGVLLQALLVLSPVILAGLVVQCISAAAVYRIIFRHDDTRFGYLRFGMDEVRLMALTMIFLGLAIVLLVAVMVAAIIVYNLAQIAGGAVAQFVGMVSQIFIMGLLFYILVRLSLAPVATFVERRLVIFGSWRLTAGQFWRLLLAYVLAICCMVAVFMLTLVILYAVAGVIVLSTGGLLSDVAASFSPNSGSLQAYLAPSVIAYLIVGSFISALNYAVIAAPGAVAYRDLHGDDAPALGAEVAAS